MENQIVSLNLSKEIINPIVERSIKEAVVAAMGGSDEILKKVMDSIIYQKVDKDGKVGSYSSENKYYWIDIVLTKQIEVQVKEEIMKIVSASASKIKTVLMNRLKSMNGASLVADALLAGLGDTFKNSWRSTIDIKLTQNNSE